MTPTTGIPVRLRHGATRPPASRVSDSAAHSVADMAEKRGTGGRPSKGERRALITRVRPELHEEIQNRADAAEMSISDYLGRLLAEHVASEPAPTGAQQRLFHDEKEMAMTG